MPGSGSTSLLSPCDAERPWLDLAASVLVRAIMDWRAYGHKADLDIGDRAYARDIRDRFGFGSPHEELEAFFDSEWCKFLLTGFPVEYEVVMAALGG